MYFFDIFYNLINFIGYSTPFIMIIISFFLLLDKSIYLNYFWGGLIINNIINILLKLIIKEPRPNDDYKKIELAVKHGEPIYFDKFGMPSAHLQNSLFIFTYTLLVLGISNLKNVSILYIILIAICGYQRVISKNHTVLQLVIGSIIGFIIGYTVYFFANKKVIGQIKEKNDDNCRL